jgi:aspartyl-tRNA(Asn)/glutamyl-tRNA(Gln) amidotransferase subunit A
MTELALMSTQISDLTVADLGKLYERGSLSPVDVALTSLEKTEQYTRLNVFVRPPDRERILAEARQSEERWRNKSTLGMLDGVPIGLSLASAWSLHQISS